MNPFGELPEQYDPHDVEEQVSDRWEEVDAYRKTKERFSEYEDFYFLDGPPYTSGIPHIGTAWNKTLKDLYIRFRRMQGHDVHDRPGYDMHGLPIETKVEKNLGFDSKKEIREYGVDEFTTECREFGERYLDVITESFQSFGVWMDWEEPYKTLSDEYMNATWWSFKQVYDRGLVERGKKSISQCPRCETAIANNEVEYSETEDPSIYVKLPLRDRDCSLVVWTTTPWTLVANTFVAVDGELTYVVVDAEGDGGVERLVVAEACVEDVLEEGGYHDHTVVEECSGDELVGWEYEHPLADEVPDHPAGDRALRVYTAGYVEADRTGLVHSAPGHGEEDFERGTELGVDVFSPVASDGSFTEAAGTYAGQYIRDANDRIIDDLGAKGLLLASGTISHRYGYCWRCDTGIVQLVTDQWFVTITDIKDGIIDNIDDSQWYPQWARDNRFRKFVEESPDWNISRQRYWGTPIPIWLPDGWEGDMDEAIVAGSFEELADLVDQDVDPEGTDFHRPAIDDLTITRDGREYTRVSDVFDVWFDSGVASWASLDYPGTPDRFERLWPADLIIEAHDQTRGWFWSQLVMGTAVMDGTPYENVLMYGHTLDPDGRKMSKSVGNTVEPGEAIEENGADAMRLFLLSCTPQGEDMRFSWDGMEEMQRRLNIIWNVFRFPLPYMRLDDFRPDGVTLAGVETEVTDRWVLSRLESVKATVTSELEAYRNDHALDALLSFLIDDVSRFYVQTVRERLWTEEGDASKKAAYATLYRVLRESVVLLAPFAPFVTEELYHTLTGDDDNPTVHMSQWPERTDRWHDPELEGRIGTVRRIEEAGAKARQQAGRKLRWPVPRVVVASDEERVVDAVEHHAALLGDRLNSKTVVCTGSNEWDELQYSAEADMSELGPAFGEDAQEIMRTLNEVRIDEPTLATLEAAVADELGRPVELGPEMVEFVREPPAGVVSAVIGTDEERLGRVYIDTSVTEEIKSEGYAQDIVRRIQEMRRDLDLDLDERIRLEFSVADDRVADLVRGHEATIAAEVRAGAVEAVDDGYRATWDIEETEVDIAIEPLDDPA